MNTYIPHFSLKMRVAVFKGTLELVFSLDTSLTKMIKYVISILFLGLKYLESLVPYQIFGSGE